MIQHINRSHHKFDIPLRIDVIEGFPRHFMQVLNVHILINNHDDFRKHCLTQAPNAMHDFSRVSGVPFGDAHDHQVMEDAFKRHMHVDNFRKLFADDWQKQTFHCLAHVIIFLRRNSNNDRMINGILPVSNCSQVECGVQILL